MSELMFFSEVLDHFQKYYFKKYGRNIETKLVCGLDMLEKMIDPSKDRLLNVL